MILRAIEPCALSLALLLAGGSAWAMPNLGRRENVPCAACHTQVPRLNRAGYAYRRAGWRLPENLGKEDEKPFNLGDFFSARIQGSVDYAHRNDDDDVQIQFRGLTLFPLTGAWGGFVSSMAELSISPESFFEIENAYVRANYGEPNYFGHARFGIFHPFEGYGASDRPNSIARPLFQTTPANFNQSTLFRPWGFDQAGLELGYTYEDFSASATVFNGIFARREDAAIMGFPAQGGELAKTASAPSRDTKDIQVFLNQMIGERVGASAFYYHGWLDLPRDPTMSLTQDNLWRNSFDRFALYAYAQVWSYLTLQAGGQLGMDHYLDASTGSTGNTFRSGGAFGEVLVPFPTSLTGMGSLRYDYFDPSDKKSGDQIHAVTAAVNWTLPVKVRVLSEYRFIDTAQGRTNDRREHVAELRMIWIL